VVGRIVYRPVLWCQSNFLLLQCLRLTGEHDVRTHHFELLRYSANSRQITSMEVSFKPSLLVTCQTDFYQINLKSLSSGIASCMFSQDQFPKWPSSLPILLDFESPFELQVSLLVVVHELGHSVVFAPGQHAGRSSFRFDCVELACTCNTV